MKFLQLFLVVFYLLCCPASSEVAPKISGSIDLSKDEIGFVSGGVQFSETNVNCPESYWLMSISGPKVTSIYTHKEVSEPTNPTVPDFSSNHKDTYKFSAETKTCKFVLKIRHQFLKDENWVSLPTTSIVDPPEDEAREAALIDENKKKRLKAGNLQISGLSEIQTHYFEKSPEACFDVVGDFTIDQDRFIFSFMTNLSVPLNRFKIERADMDDGQSKLYFTQDKCRYELTVSSFVLRDGKWVARTPNAASMLKE